MDKRQNGFTLVEIAIVMIIIGLIVGGVMKGRDLLRNSEMTSVISDRNKYLSAVDSFEEKYQQLPGDMTDADKFWSACVDSGNNVCNGDGNGQINPGDENFRAWQQLSLAQIITGGYSGVSDRDATGTRLDGSAVMGDNPNTPSSIIKNAGWGFYSTPLTGYRVYNNLLIIGAPDTNLTGGPTNHTVFTVHEAKSIDIKLDDGSPTTGEILAGEGANSATGCVDTNTVADLTDDVYNVTIDTKVCILGFVF